MSHRLHPAPSVGSLVKKLMRLHPELTAQDMIEIVKQSIDTLGAESGDFHGAETLNEARALELARAKVTAPDAARH